MRWPFRLSSRGTRVAPASRAAGNVRHLFEVVADKRDEREANGRLIFREVQRKRDAAAPTAAGAPPAEVEHQVNGFDEEVGGGDAVATTAIESAPDTGEGRARFRIAWRLPSFRVPFALVPRPHFGFVAGFHAPRLRMTKGRLSIISALVIALAVGTGVFAYWTAGGTGTADAAATTLTEPDNVEATPAAPSVLIEWDASFITGPQVPAQSYDVRRYDGDDDSDLGPACGGSIPSSAGDPDPSGHFECTDLPPAAGSFKYRITANFATWTARAALRARSASARWTTSTSMHHRTRPPAMPST